MENDYDGTITPCCFGPHLFERGRITHSPNYYGDNYNNYSCTVNHVNGPCPGYNYDPNATAPFDTAAFIDYLSYRDDGGNDLTYFDFKLNNQYKLLTFKELGGT
jgi:hypothetical protein